MFKVLFITFSGIGLGYLFRKAAWVAILGRCISYTIWLLLFFFGLQVGSNEHVVSNLDTLGLKAMLIAFAGSLGSCIMAWLIYRYVSVSGDMPYLSGDKCEDISVNPTSSLESGSTESDSSVTASVVSASAALRFMDKFMQNVGGFIVVAFFAVGCVCGWLGFVPEMLTDGKVAIWVLYLLMLQVGMSIGSDSRLKEIVLSLKPRLLLLPLGTIAGTLLAVLLLSFFMADMKIVDCMAVGAGFGYYSLSSVLITQIKEPQAGAAFAAQLGTIALMANIMREVLTLLAAPLIYKVFGRFAPISVGGATSMDSTLPVITAVCGKEMAFISIFHGVTVDFTVPFLVTFFASL